MRRGLLLVALSISSVWTPLLPAQSQPGGNIAVNSSDLGYRIGSIEAKIENQSKALDEMKAGLKTTNDNLAALTAQVKETGGAIRVAAWLLGAVVTALIANLIALWFKGRNESIATPVLATPVATSPGVITTGELQKEIDALRKDLEHLSVKDFTDIDPGKRQIRRTAAMAFPEQSNEPPETRPELGEPHVP